MAHINRHFSRRGFLQRAGSLGALAGTPFLANLAAIGAAGAESSTGHKALVCIFLNGGNDQSNTIFPVSGADYQAYLNARPLIAVDSSQALALSPQGYSGARLGLHGSLAPLKALFDQGKAAVVANVGPLAAPLTQAQWNNGDTASQVPFQLFSHSSQQGAWQTGVTQAPTETGWLGRMGDLTASAFNPGSGVSVNVSTAGNNIMQAGASTVQYQLTTQGAVRIGALYAQQGDPWSPVSPALLQIMTGQRTNLLERELTSVARRSISSEAVVNAALASVPAASGFPQTGLGLQLAVVSRMIAAHGALGQRRQIYFVQAGGYDFHADLPIQHAARMSELAGAMAAFYQATVALGLESSVTTFTASDFGRALQSNGRGSDHGWGAHHFVMGGAVLGNKVYGKFPVVAINGPEDAGQGRLIPTTSVDEYAATLARWFGVSDTDMPVVMPNIGRFSTPNLGFLAAA